MIKQHRRSVETLGLSVYGDYINHSISSFPDRVPKKYRGRRSHE